MSDPFKARQEPITVEARQAFQFYQNKKFAELRSFVASQAAKIPNDFGLIFLGGLAACRLGDPAVGLREIKKAKLIFPEIEDYYSMEVFNRQNGMVSVADHLEANFIQYCNTFTTENFLISYPKCGRTWVRIVLGKYLLGGKRGNPIDLTALTFADPSLPTTIVTHDDGPHLIPSAKIMVNKAMYHGKRIIFLVRDPRDVMVSNYFQYTKRNDNELANQEVFRGNLSDFIRSDVGGISSLIKFYNVWAENKEIPNNYEVVFYEDIHLSPLNSFKNMLQTFQYPDFGDRALTDAIRFGEFENLQKMEDVDAFDDARLRIADPGDPESRKIRRGKISGYVDYLTKSDIHFCNEIIQRQLHSDYQRYVT